MLRQLTRIIVVLSIIVALYIHYQSQLDQSLDKILNGNQVEPKSSVIITNEIPKTATDNSVVREYKWQAVNRQWSWQISLNQGGYEYFKGLLRVPTDDYSVYVTKPDDDVYLDELVQEFLDARIKANLSENQMVELVVAFVQSIPYVEDKIGTGQNEYPKYPLETLYEQSGDCEDKSILMASLLDKLGYKTVLLVLPNHMAVGVKGAESLPGNYINYQGDRYYYLETTGENWQIGDAPSEVIDSKARILSLIPRPVITHRWESKGSLENYRVVATVENLGTGTAQNTLVYASFDAGNNQVYAQNSSETVSIPPGGKATFTVKLDYPREVKTRIQVQVIIDGVLDSESSSKWFATK